LQLAFINSTTFLSIQKQSVRLGVKSAVYLLLDLKTS